MLLFNPIISQSRATQSLKNFGKRLRGVGWGGGSSVGARCALKCPTKFYFLICNTEETYIEQIVH